MRPSGLRCLRCLANGRDVPERAARGRRAPIATRGLLADLLRSVISTVATALSLRLCYSVDNGRRLLALTSQVQPGEAPVPQVPPVPSILHLVHAAIAALLLAIQFTPFLRPQAIAEQDHPIARKCLAQFIAGWRWAWVAWLALYCWLWVHAEFGREAGCRGGHTQLPDFVPPVLVLLCAGQAQRGRAWRPGAQCVVPKSHRHSLGNRRRSSGPRGWPAACTYGG